MYTKGTYVDPNPANQNYEPNYVLGVRLDDKTNEIGVCFFDISTSKCFLG